jgi:hypothetical protein
MRNFDSGELLVFSTHQMRLHRMKRRIKAWSEAVKHLLDGGKGRYVLKMLTLTYRDIAGWEANHIRDFMNTVKGKMGDDLLSYAWVCEVQKRGAPHYHVMLLVKRGTWVPKPDKAGWWVHGSTNVLQAESPWYLMKYTGKEYQKAYQQQGLPKGARMFGCPQKLGAAAASPDAEFDFRLSAIPNWLAQKIQPIRVGYGLTVTWKRAEGGGWWLRWYEDGELQEKRVYSPWLFEGIERIEPYEYVNQRE